MSVQKPDGGLSAELAQVHADVRRLDAIMARVMEALAANGFQIAVDLTALSNAAAKRVESAVVQAEALEKQAEHSAGLLRTFSMISSSLELSDVLSEVMDTVIALTGAERAYLVLCEPGTGALETAVARNWDRESLSESDVVFSRSIINRAIAEGVPMITTNATSDDRFLNVQSVVSHGLRAILCIPLMIRGRAMGVLYADNRLSQDVFLNDSIALLTAFGTQAAIAIENARQYGRVRSISMRWTACASRSIACAWSTTSARSLSRSTSSGFRSLPATCAAERRGRCRMKALIDTFSA
jgi:transcriptional regulator with GAF, ATPase, and Fis domain